MSQAKWPEEIAQRIFDILEANKTALIGDAASLFYGDQNRLPTTPTLCVEAGPTTRPLAGAASPGGMIVNNHECYILLYHAVVQSGSVTKKQSEQIASGIVNFLDQNHLRLQLPPTDIQGIVIHGYCVSIDPGYSIKEGTLYQAVRIVWQGTSKTRLGA